jgi:hypothetical protein
MLNYLLPRLLINREPETKIFFVVQTNKKHLYWKKKRRGRG